MASVMIDVRPVVYVIGLLVTALGGTMLLPMAADMVAGNGHWPVFFESAAVTIAIGTVLALSCANSPRDHLTLQQTFLVTTGVWLALPIFGAIPFLIGGTAESTVDGFFESMSGLTTTGATVLNKLDKLPEGVLLWRGMLQWFGGIGIIVVAMVFLPELGVGGMQIFRSEGFDTDGKILPRATAIAAQIAVIYLTLTVVCGLTYTALGMSGFDAAVHAMTTLATGGFANYDNSFGAFGPAVHYAAVVFMILAALPFVRYVQFLAGSVFRIAADTQVRVFLWVLAVNVAMLTAWLWSEGGVDERSFREALFNGVSIQTGTGYASANYMTWGSFPVTLIFFIGLVGGCAGSTTCSIKIFRYQLLFASLKAQIRRIHSPSGLFSPRYNGRVVEDAVLSSVMSYFVLFILSMGVLSVLLAMTGLDLITSVSGSATALANIGPGLGPEIGPAGNFGGLNDTAKWLLAAAMLLGRLELLAVLTILRLQFWQA